MESRKICTLKVVKDLFERNPRISYSNIHKVVRRKIGIRMRDTTRRYIEFGYNKEILFPPRPVLRYHEDIHLHIQFVDGDLTDFENIINQKGPIRYACALAGSCECIMTTSFRPVGDDLLFQRFTRANGYNVCEKESFQHLLFFDETPIKVFLESEDLTWDRVDWELFDLLSPNFRAKYTDLSNVTGVEWRTVKARVEKRIIPACHTATYFFPRGQKSYQYVFLLFKTEYQENFMKKLDFMQTTTYYLLFGNSQVGVFIFPENMNNLIKLFKKLEKDGIIDDMRYFLPLAWEHIADLSWSGARTWPT